MALIYSKGMSVSMIRDMLENIIDNILVTWIHWGKYPSRLTFVQENQCYICNNYSDNTVETYTDDYKGCYGHYGWIYCPKCKIYAELGKYYNEIACDHLFRNKYKELVNHKLSFWRNSRTKTIAPYIERNAQLAIGTNAICIKNNRVVAVVEWDLDKVPLKKYIPLSNIIYFNPKYFGNNVLKSPLLSDVINNKLWIDKWQPLIHNEYIISLKWLNFILYANTCVNKIPSVCIRIIFEYYSELYYVE